MPLRLTKNFSLDEMLISETATRKGYEEQYHPDNRIIENLILLCENILQPLRSELRKAIHVTSGYRCLRTNKAIGGSTTSQHIKGQAADIHVTGMTTQELFERILTSEIKFDQMIQEFDRWVHVSFRNQNNRGDKLYAVKVAGKTKYLRYNGKPWPLI